MNLQALNNWIFCIFHMFGHVSYNPLIKFKYIPKCIIHFTPTSLYLSLSTFVLFSITYYQITHPRFTKTVINIGFLFISTEYLCAFTAVFQSIFCCQKMLQMSYVFQSIEQYLVKSVGIKINFSTQYLIKVVIILFIYSSMVSTKFFWPANNTNSPIIELGFSLLRLFVIVPKLHALFYINLLKWFIKLSKNMIEMEVNVKQLGFVQWKYELQMIKMLKHYKVIHFKLFVACQHINDIFGWSSVVLCMIQFLENAFMLYLVFFYFHEGQNTDFLNTLSKYIHLFWLL